MNTTPASGLPGSPDEFDGATPAPETATHADKADPAPALASAPGTKEAAAPAAKPPFHSFTFSLSDRAIGRRLLSLAYRPESDDYELHVESGSRAVPESEFTRSASRRQAEALRDALAAIDAFNWETEYGDEIAPGTRRWNVNIVFEKDVFSVASFGGSTVPNGFDTLLETLYQLDLPRPETARVQHNNEIAANLAHILPPDADSALLQEMQQAMAELQSNPERFASQLKEEFRALSPEMQSTFLDMLSASGMGDREYWKRFFGLS